MAVISAIVAAVASVATTIAAGAAAAGTMIAAGAATAAGMAAVGSGLVAVASVVGVAGLATSVIGMATGNKDLLKAGKVMGYIGLAGGIAGGITGGIGGMMEGGSGFLEGVKGAFTGVAGAADAAPTQADLAQTGSTMFSSEAGTSVTGPMTSIPGVEQASQIYTASPASMSAEGAAGNLYNSPIEAATQAAAASATPLADTSTLAGDPSSLATPVSANPSVAGSSPLQPPVSSPVSAQDAAAITPPAVDQASAIAPPEVINQADIMHQGLVDSATGAPALRLNTGVEPFAANFNPSAVTPPPAVGGSMVAGGQVPQGNLNLGVPDQFQTATFNPNPLTGAGAATPAPPSMWASMPEWAKYSAMTTGMQGLTGLASGYYQGLSAEEKLKFEKMVNDQHQQQVNLMNTRSSYAPRVSFNRPKGGLVNA